MLGKRSWVLALFAPLLVLSGCGGSKSEEQPSQPPEAAQVPSVAATSCLRMVVPAYFYPGGSSNYWQQATTAPTKPAIMIMNPSSGPGASKDSNYDAAVIQARAAGVEIFGYISTTYGARSKATVMQEVDRYAEWYNVKSIFLDEAGSDTSELNYYRDLAQTIRSRSGARVMLNPGVIPAEAYAEVGDIVVTFEESASAYQNWVQPSWATKYPAERFAHLIYGAPNTAALEDAVNKASTWRAGFLFITNDTLDNPWDTLPSYWPQELALTQEKCIG